MKLSSHFHLVPRLRISGAMPQLPLYTFMASTGNTQADVVKRRPPTAKARVQSQTVTCLIFGKQSDTSAGFFLRVLRFSRVIIIPSVLSIIVLIRRTRGDSWEPAPKKSLFLLLSGNTGQDISSYCLHFGRNLLPRRPGFESGSVQGRSTWIYGGRSGGGTNFPARCLVLP